MKYEHIHIFIQRLITLLSICIWPVCVIAQEEADDTVTCCEDTCSHVHGIDLSHYQGQVFWTAIGNNKKMSYVYLKATEGGDHIDKRYEENIREAKASGLLVGSYHFFRPKTPLHLQLENFITQCRPEDQDIVPMIDIETTAKLPTEAFVDSLTTFLTMIEDYYGQKPLIYTGANFYDKHLSGGLLDAYKIMIAQYTENEPVLIDDRDITLWQYTAKGNIPGVKGNIDKSRFLGRHGIREIRYKANNQTDN